MAVSIRRPAQCIRGKRARQVHILTGIPGVGAFRATRLLDHFGTVEGVTTASPGALAEVEGIGK
jgi:ERCC4-type nuclease